MQHSEDANGIYRQRAAEYYDYQSTGLPGDADFYVEEARRAGSPVLELGCGTGRILLPIAEAGVEVVGLDASDKMLAIAREKIAQVSQETQNRISLVQGDMRDFALERTFRAIFVPYRAFLHLMTPEDQKQALACFRKHLDMDGRLIFNIFDPRHDVLGQSSLFGSALTKQGAFVYPKSGRQVFVWACRHYDKLNQVIQEDRLFEEIDAQGQVVSRCYAPLVLRYAFRYEIEHLLELCGFEIESLYGDFQRGAFQYGGEQVWVARPRA